jgi:hypothetical protein
VSTFHGLLAPPDHIVRQLSEQYPRVPFVTPEYVQAYAAIGEIPCALLANKGDARAGGTIGSVKKGRLSSFLQISSAPRLSDPSRFWPQLQSFCRWRRIWHLLVQTYASECADIPRLRGENLRYPRFEHVIGLQNGGRLALSAQHQRSVSKAERAGLTITATRSAGDHELHKSLLTASLHRRSARLDDDASLDAMLARRASHDLAAGLPFELALLASGAAEIFQARRGAEVLASLFALRAPAAVYYRSGGTSELGMSLGASAFLVAACAQRFQDEGKREFNLGGSGPSPTGLWRFKSGFGSEQRALEAVEVSTEPALIGALRWVSAIRHRRRARGSASAGAGSAGQSEQPSPTPATPSS